MRLGDYQSLTYIKKCVCLCARVENQIGIHYKNHYNAIVKHVCLIFYPIFLFLMLSNFISGLYIYT